MRSSTLLFSELHFRYASFDSITDPLYNGTAWVVSTLDIRGAKELGGNF